MGAQGANIRLEGFVTTWQEIKRRKIRKRGKKKIRKSKGEGKKKGEIIHQ